MGSFIKSDLEKVLKEAEKRASGIDHGDPLATYGDKMAQEVANLMRKDKSFGYHIEGKISGGSFILSPLNRLSKKGRAFEETMDKQGSDEYRSQFTKTWHENRARTDGERQPDNPIYDNYDPDAPELIQDVEKSEERSNFATHRGKNDVTIDLVLTGRMYTKVIDENGVAKKKLAPHGIDDIEPQSVETGQFSEVKIDPKTGQEYQDPILVRDVDGFHAQYEQRVIEAEAINRANLEALGYDIIEPGEDGYREQQIQIANDPRFIETFPDLEGLPLLKDKDGNVYEPEFTIVMHINGKKVDAQDMDLAFDQLTRKGAYEKTGLENGRDFLVQQGIRGAAFHASVIPQQMVGNAIKMPSKLAREGNHMVVSGVLSQIMQALGRGMSR